MAHGSFGLIPPVAALDVYRSAWLIIKRHGEHAVVVAATRADELLGRGDLEGQRTWLRIVDAIRDLQSKEVPDPGAAACYRVSGLPAMTSDLDIYRSAWLIIKRHGDDAIVHAANILRAYTWACFRIKQRGEFRPVRPPAI